MELASQNSRNTPPGVFTLAFSILLATAFLLTPGASLFGATEAPANGFAGTWKAVYRSKVIVVLRLRGGQHPSGTIQLAGFQSKATVQS